MINKKILARLFMLTAFSSFSAGEISFKKQNEKKSKEELEQKKEEKNVRSSTRYGNKRDRIVEFAKKQIGKPYFYGASGSEMFDCSSFVQYVFKTAANINLPRVSYQQAEFKPKITSNIKKGDLLFFETLGKGRISHVGIYIGNRQFIHASSKSKKVTVSDFSGFYQEKFRWAVSVI